MVALAWLANDSYGSVRHDPNNATGVLENQENKLCAGLPLGVALAIQRHGDLTPPIPACTVH
jgi:hypothetical protein